MLSEVEALASHNIYFFFPRSSATVIPTRLSLESYIALIKIPRLPAGRPIIPIDVVDRNGNDREKLVSFQCHSGIIFVGGAKAA